MPHVLVLPGLLPEPNPILESQEKQSTFVVTNDTDSRLGTVL